MLDLYNSRAPESATCYGCLAKVLSSRAEEVESGGRVCPHEGTAQTKFLLGRADIVGLGRQDHDPRPGNGRRVVERRGP